MTAVFAANDQMALGCLAAAKQLGIQVPEDVSVVGFDDIPEAGFFSPALTTVRLDFTEIGQRCVDRLLRQIGVVDGELSPIAAPEVIVRSSTAPPQQEQ